MPNSSLRELSSQLLLDEFARGRPEAANEICARYLARLTALAESRTSSALQSRYDGADAVQSALRSFFLRAGRGDFQLQRSGDLWRLLATLTVRKVLKRVEREQADKRTPERTSGGVITDMSLLADRQPTPDDVAALDEIMSKFLARLSPEIREVVTLRMEDHSTSDIAQRVARSERTVRRWLEFAQSELEALLAGEAVDCR